MGNTKLVGHVNNTYSAAISDGRISDVQVNASQSLEATLNEVRQTFSLKVILVNHEKRLITDTTCCNLAIKYNVIFISAYQLIKKHIEGHTEWGKKLLAARQQRDIKLQS